MFPLDVQNIRIPCISCSNVPNLRTCIANLLLAIPFLPACPLPMWSARCDRTELVQLNSSFVLSSQWKWARPRKELGALYKDSCIAAKLKPPSRTDTKYPVSLNFASEIFTNQKLEVWAGESAIYELIATFTYQRTYLKRDLPQKTRLIENLWRIAQ